MPGIEALIPEKSPEPQFDAKDRIEDGWVAGQDDRWGVVGRGASGVASGGARVASCDGVGWGADLLFAAMEGYRQGWGSVDGYRGMDSS